MASRKRKYKKEETKMRNTLKKMILTAVLVFGTLVVFPTNAEAKTKTLTYNINKVSANKFCEDVYNKGADAVFLESDKNTYKIKLTVKAASKKEGRAKVKKFAKKVMNAKTNQFGLSYGIKYDDYNYEKYDAKKKVYTTELYQSANDLYYLNAITKKALHDTSFYDIDCSVNINKVFPDYNSFKKSSDSVKTQFILGYMGTHSMSYNRNKKGMSFSWKKAFYGKMGGVCSDYANMYGYALRLVAYDYDLQYEINWKANHEIILVKAKNNEDAYDYLIGDNGCFSNYIVSTSAKNAEMTSSNFAVWQIKAPKEYRVSKLEKAAYSYGKNQTKSDLYELFY